MTTSLQDNDHSDGLTNDVCFICQSPVREITFSDQVPSIATEVCPSCWGIAARRIAKYNKEARRHRTAQTLQAEEWFEILKASEGRCHYCKKHIGFETLITEHLTPLSIGGDNAANNVAASCNACNASKGECDIITWHRHLEARHLTKELQSYLGLSKFEVTNLAIKALAEKHGIKAQSDLLDLLKKMSGRAEE